MKVIISDNKIVIYLYNYFFNSLNKDILMNNIKDIIIKLIKKYNLEFSGLYETNIYENNKYGSIIEINKINEFLFNKDRIDIKIKLFKNCNIYFKTKDYFILSKYNNIYYKDNYYYININNIDNLLNIIEFIDIVYNKKDNYLNKFKLIK